MVIWEVEIKLGLLGSGQGFWELELSGNWQFPVKDTGL